MAYADEEITIEVQGLDELGKKLDSLSQAIQTRILRHALQFGGEVFVPELVARAPINTEGVTDATHTTRLVPGMLKFSMGVAINMQAPQGPTAFIGSDKRARHVLNWIENGFNLTTHGRRTKAKKNLATERKIIRHIPAHPILRPVFDELYTEAVMAFSAAITDGINVELGTSPVAGETIPESGVA